MDINLLKPIFFGYVFMISAVFAQGQELNTATQDLFRQLEEIRGSDTSDSVEVDVLNEISHQYVFVNLDSALLFAKEAEAKATLLNYPNGIGKAWNLKGIVNKTQGRFDLALVCYDSSLFYYRRADNPAGMAQAWVNQGVIWRKQTNYGNALEVYVKALDVFERLEDTINLAHTYNNMASVYGKQGNFEEALNWYVKCSDLQRAAHNKIGEARSLSNIAVVYYKQRNWPDAEKSALKSLAIHQEQGNIKGQAKIFNMLGVISYDSGEPVKALNYYEEALSANIELGTLDQVISVQDNLASLYTSQNQPSKAIAYYESNLQLAAEIGLPEMLMETNQDLSELYEQQGQTALALKHYKAYNSWKDTVFNVEKQKLEADAMEKFETIQKEQEIKALKRDGIIDGLLLSGKDDSITIRNTFLVIGGLGLVITLIVGFNFLARARAQRLLREKDKELNTRRMTEVMDTNEKKVLQAYLEGEDQERKRIAEDLHDRIGSNLLTVKLYVDKMNEDFADSASEDIKENLGKVGDVVNGTIGEVRHVAHNLASGAISKFGLVTALEDLCATIKGAGQVDVMLDVFDMNSELPRSTDMQLFLVIRELIANTLKHANAKLITISLSQEDGQLHAMITDDGKGFDYSEKQGKSGIGLQNCLTRIDKLGGQMTVDSQQGHGTSIIFDVPIKDTLTENID